MEQTTPPTPPDNSASDTHSNIENAEAATPSGGSPQEASKDARTMALLSHLLGVFTSFIVPLIIWLVKKDEDTFIESQAKEALNFQITVILSYVAATVIAAITAGVGAILFPVIGIGNLVYGIIAAIKSNDGINYQYPITLRLIK